MATIHSDRIVDNPNADKGPSLGLMTFEKRDQTLPIERAYIFTDRDEFKAWVEKEGGYTKSFHLANLIIIGEEVVKSRHTRPGKITPPYQFL